MCTHRRRRRAVQVGVLLAGRDAGALWSESAPLGHVGLHHTTRLAAPLLLLLLLLLSSRALSGACSALGGSALEACGESEQR